MIQSTRFYESDRFDPHYNLALEKHLMDTTPADGCTLYLWQNQNTVVIGRNQNAWAECRTSLLEQEGGVLARRLSGGGAVFHDIGNLNFTFLVGKDHYDLDKQLLVIIKACALAGIQAVKSGRNDLLAEGRKFSGNAFYHNATHAYHHGTLLIDVDMDKLQRYLSPPKAKLEAKGVASVRSRVTNLNELCPGLTVEKMKEYMLSAFREVYGFQPEPVRLSEEEVRGIEVLGKYYGSWDYLYGAPLQFTFQCGDYFPWGYFQLQLQAKGGFIEQAGVNSDTMDWQIPAAVQQALIGCRFEKQAMEQALRSAISNSQIADDLCGLLDKQDI